MNKKWMEFKLKFYWTIMFLGIRTDGISARAHRIYNELHDPQKIWADIYQKCAELIYEMLAAWGWDQKYLGYQEGGI